MTLPTLQFRTHSTLHANYDIDHEAHTHHYEMKCNYVSEYILVEAIHNVDLCDEFVSGELRNPASPQNIVLASVLYLLANFKHLSLWTGRKQSQPNINRTPP